MEEDAPDFQVAKGRIDRLEVENFKSYRGVHQIGPFKGFTAVIGPNGSGKSNLMDAIVFVLGVRTTQIRGSLKELLYVNTGGEGAEDAPCTAHVKLVFVEVDDEGVETDLLFSRHIQPASSNDPNAYTSVYKIGGQTVSFDAYCQKLGSLGVLVKVRNFLVFQGDIEAVASKDNRGLTTLFEQIAGSDALAKEYQLLEEAKNKMEKEVAILFTRKKAVVAERKLKKEQKEEAEKHVALQEELKALKAEHVMWQLQCLQRDMGEKRAERQKAEAQLMKVAAENMKYDAEVESMRKKSAGLAKEKLLAEKKVKKLQGERDKLTPKLLASKEEMSRVANRIKADLKEVADTQSRIAAQAKAIKKLKKDLAEVNAAIAAESQKEQAHQAEHLGDMLSSPEVQAEYNTLRNEVGAKTAKLTGERATLMAEQQAEEEQLQQLRAAAAQLQQRLAGLEVQRTEAADKLAAGMRQHGELTAAVAVKTADKQKVSEQRTIAIAKREHGERKLAEVESTLEEARGDRRADRREADLAETVEALKKLLPGVYGRLPDLCTVTQRRYNLAMAVALGKDVDTVVVDTDAKAKECIQHLKDQRKPPLTFMALNYIKAKPINERLRTLGGTCKMAIDLVEFDPKFQPAFASSLSNTLVCDTIEEARDVAFRGMERHKVVSLDGTLFNKAGTITGGSGGAQMAGRAARMDDKLVQEGKAERERLIAVLAKLPSTRLLVEAEASVSSELAGLQAKLSYCEADNTITRGKIAKLEGDIARCQADLQRRLPDSTKLEGLVSARGTKLQAMQKRINDVTDRMFKPLSARLGVPNIREYEEGHAAFRQESDAKKVELANQCAKIQAQLVYDEEQQPKAQAALLRASKQQANDEALLQRLRDEGAAGQAEVDRLQGEVQTAVDRLGELAAQVVAEAAQQATLHKSTASLGAEGVKMKRAVGACTAALEALAVRAEGILQAAAMEQVDLPRKKGKGAAAAAAAADAEADADDAMDAEGPGASADGDDVAVAGGGDVTAAVALQLAALDFSALKRSLQTAMPAKERETTEGGMKAKLEEVCAALLRSLPNLKALEQYEAMKAREKEQASTLQKAKEDATGAAEAFHRVRARRHDLFVRAFTHISAQIDVIYKELTKSPVHQLGGTAYLHLENEELPYLHGIKFTAIPPTKRFRDMDQMSGGEKTVAALALLFAIHSYRPSPFFVLDEVDAALDATNVARVAHYIRAKTRSDRDDGFQSIVISLKDIFYEKADALVGVCKDLGQSCSKTYTFDLSRFNEPMADT